MSLKGYQGPANLPDRYVVSSARPTHANDNAQALDTGGPPRARQSHRTVLTKPAVPTCEIVELV